MLNMKVFVYITFGNQAYSEYKHSLTFRIHAVVIATKPVHRLQFANSAQLGGTPYHTASDIWVPAEVWTCGDRQTHTDTVARDQYTSCVIYDSRKM